MRILAPLALLIASSALQAQAPELKPAQKAEHNPAHAGFIPPPGLAAFEFQAPDAVAFARLWVDVGMFHPFTGGITRQAWDRAFFDLLNQVTAGKLSLQEGAAAAIGALGDTGSIVLTGDEGTGGNVLPVIFEARKNGIWIIGGSKAVLSAPFGPIATVNGTPLQKWMAGHIGTAATSDQQIGALVTVSQAPKPQDWTFGTADGHQLALKSVSAIPTDAWIEGGWKGVPFHQLAATPPADIMQKVDALDLRTMSWAPASPSLEQLTFLLARVAKHSSPINETKWAHRGFSNGVPVKEYTSTLVTEGLFEPADGPNSKAIAVTLPVPFLASRNTTWAMGGWGVPKGVSLAGERTTYSLNKGVQVRLVTTFLSDNAPDQSRSLYGGPIEFFGPDRPATWKALSVPAAKNLAAATLLDFFQHFGFMKTEIQEQAFKGIAALPEKSSSVHDLILRASRFAQEAHITSYALDFRDLKPGDWESGASTKHSRLPFIGRTLPDGNMDALIVGVGVPIKVGAIVTAINGQPMKDLIAEMAFRVPTPENEFRICKDMGMLFPFDTPLSITFRNPGEKERTEKMDPVTYDGPWQPEDPSILKALENAGWTYIGDRDHADSAAILEGLSKGKNYLFDLRTTSIIPSADDSPFPANSTFQWWARTTSTPTTWGDPTASSSFFVQNDPDSSVHSGKVFPGKVATLVWGVTQSSIETAAVLMKHRFVSNSYTVGTRTSGMTGGVTYIKLPLGDSERFEVASPTGEWPLLDGLSIQYKGVPLDMEFSHAEIQKAIAAGSPDPYITVFLTHLGELK